MNQEIANLISDALQALGSLFAKLTTDSTGLPRIPSLDVAANKVLATKWYTKPGYFTRYATGPLANAATQAAGILYWTIQITEDGWARAWYNFSHSTQPVADGVPASVAAMIAAGTDGGPGSAT
jgi:hypothetical protein